MYAIIVPLKCSNNPDHNEGFCKFMLHCRYKYCKSAVLHTLVCSTCVRVRMHVKESNKDRLDKYAKVISYVVPLDSMCFKSLVLLMLHQNISLSTV